MGRAELEGRKTGLNFSRVLENSLRELLAKLEKKEEQSAEEGE